MASKRLTISCTIAGLGAAPRISIKNIYNFDETGFQLGQGRPQNVITRYQYSAQKVAAQDWGQIITSIECIAAVGWVMVPYLILKGQTHIEDWFRDNPALQQNYNIQISPNGWSSDLIALEWIHLFHENTKNRVGTNGKRALFFDSHGTLRTNSWIFAKKPRLFQPALLHIPLILLNH